MDYEDLGKLLDYDKVREFRSRAINPNHPVTKGSAQNDDVYFQTREVQNKYYDAVPGIVADYMEKFLKLQVVLMHHLCIMEQKMQQILSLQWDQLQKQLKKQLII